MESLRIYKEALRLVSEIYILIRKSPQLSKDFSLCDQLKRATVSVVTNIAEGYLRTKKHFKSYLKISTGSANEVIALLQIVSMVYEIPTIKLQNSYNVLAKQISAFSKNIKF